MFGCGYVPVVHVVVFGVSWRKQPNLYILLRVFGIENIGIRIYASARYARDAMLYARDAERCARDAEMCTRNTEIRAQRGGYGDNATSLFQKNELIRCRCFSVFLSERG